ncbi:probable sulfate transporter 3.5 [Lotus japonicus]|uniref:probable sulfate transporter 3.5 n=1 Tax=Lotus japonicus TaxID=34305 RepID=UPI00258CE54D|nr:probable sulfate transporter 3.5 [Lotus japonicus]
MRYVKSQQRSNEDVVEQVILDMSGVTSIDTTVIEGLLELNKMLEKNGIEMFLVNPRLEVMEELIISKFVDKLGKESFYLTLDDAVKASQYSLKKNDNGDIVHETSHA